MFRLLESRRTARRQRGAALFSIVAHTTVIVGVVVRSATGEPTRDPDPAPPMPVYVPVLSRNPAPAPVMRAPTVLAPHAPVIVVPPIDIPTEIPPVGDATPTPVVGSPVVGGDPTGTPVTGTGTGVTYADTSAAWANQVDRTVVPLGRSRVPRYPDLLRTARQEGSVVAFFVVDTLGRVEPGSFRAAASTHALFTEAVRGVVVTVRFRPAEVGGRKVRQLVEQRFVFELRP